MLYGNTEAARSDGIYLTFVATTAGHSFIFLDLLFLWKFFSLQNRRVKWGIYCVVFAAMTCLPVLAVKMARVQDQFQYERFLTVSSINNAGTARRPIFANVVDSHDARTRGMCCAGDCDSADEMVV